MAGRLTTWFVTHKKKIAGGIFWTAFFCEVLWFTLKKFDLSLPRESLFLRGVCGLFCLKILLTDYRKKEWAVFLPCAALGVAAYFASGRGIDILFRACAMVFAAKDVSRTRAFRILFFSLLAADLWIVAGSLTGQRLLVDVRDYGRSAVERRYTFGFSHANTFHFAMWSLMMLVIYLYHDRLRRLHYALFAVCGLLITALTRSRTGGLLMAFTLALCVLFLWIPSLRRLWKLWFAAGALCLAACLGLSVAAMTGGQSGRLMIFLNRLLTGRIQWAYDAVQASFLSLFSQQGNELLIDMGYVRLIYSYGLVPAAFYLAATLYLLYAACKKQDLLAFVFVLSMVLFTTIETQQINCDIVLNYTLVMLFGRWDAFSSLRRRSASASRKSTSSSMSTESLRSII